MREAEAIRDAATVAFDGVATRVFRAEDLRAVALQKGRALRYFQKVFRVKKAQTPL
jgi:CO/xanthine dehydrogenase FAD-binding subunit